MGTPISDTRWREFQEYLKALPINALGVESQEQHEEAESLYQKFKECFSREMCDSCGKPLPTFSRNNPCFHWLLRPKGAKKDDIERLFQAKGYFRTASWIRWVANQNAFLAGINDLRGEGDQAAVFHWTARYKHLSWTFWCTKNDYVGHVNTRANMSHFHVEMKSEGRPFIRFNDFHIPFTDEDLFYLKANLDSDSVFQQSFGPHGAGMQDAMDVPAEEIIGSACSVDDERKGVYEIDTIIRAAPGQTISGDLLTHIIEKSRESGRTIAHCVREEGLDAQVLITPSDSIPEKSVRSNPRGR